MRVVHSFGVLYLSVIGDISTQGCISGGFVIMLGVIS